MQPSAWLALLCPGLHCLHGIASAAIEEVLNNYCRIKKEAGFCRLFRWPHSKAACGHRMRPWCRSMTSLLARSTIRGILRMGARPATGWNCAQRSCCAAIFYAKRSHYPASGIRIAAELCNLLMQRFRNRDAVLRRVGGDHAPAVARQPHVVVLQHQLDQFFDA